VILFSTGFFANQGALSALTESDDVILCDRENHASIIEGCDVAPAKLIPFRHNSAEVLRNRLKRLPEEAGKLIIMDGVFSMSGDVVDLPRWSMLPRNSGLSCMSTRPIPWGHGSEGARGRPSLRPQ